jgi:hypothetical protein
MIRLLTPLMPSARVTQVVFIFAALSALSAFGTPPVRDLAGRHDATEVLESR